MRYCGWVPRLTGPGTIAKFVQIGSNPLWPKTLMHILLKHNADNCRFCFVNRQIKDFMLALVETATFYKIIPVGGNTSPKAPVLNELSKSCPGSNGGLFALTVSLPKSDVVCQLVRVVVKALLSFLGMLADWESANKSRRMILSYDQRILTGQYPVADSLGLRHTKDGDLLIEPEEAKTVRFMFLASMAGYTREKIAEILTEKRRPTLKGNTKWTASMVASIMSNERTWGDLEARKTIVVDYKHGIVTKNRGQRDSAYVPGHHEGIVTPSIAKAAKMVVASSGSIPKGVFDLSIIREGTLKGFIGLCPGFAGIDAETLMSVCLDVYSGEEIQELSDRVRLISEEGQSNILSMALSGYQVPSGAYFISRSVPSLAITPRGLKFNKVCHDRLLSCKYIDVLYHPVLQTMIVRASNEDAPNSICWVNPKDKPCPTLYTRAFSKSIYTIQHWDSSMIYKVRGVLRKRGNTSFLVFSLDEPVMLPCTLQDKSPDGEQALVERVEAPDTINDELLGMAYVVRMNRESIVSKIQEDDILNHSITIENPLIGAVPTQEEIEAELEQLLQAM